MRKNYFVIILLVLFFSTINAQKEASYWFFGRNAGLDFNSGNPIADTNGSLSTIEGCASISNIAGNLLFYTDGINVWNRDHAIMPTGRPLAGHPSSTQSAIIVPKPGDSDVYYIFTVDWIGGQKGLNYFTVDMNLDEGLGDVVGIDNIPTANNLLNSPLSEKITAIKASNEEAFWIISYKQAKFYVFKVNNTGVIDLALPGNSGFQGSTDARGYLKTSPDGTKLVSANMTAGIFIYDFNSATGVVTNERELDVLGEFSYGVEFSPQSKKLYVSTGDFKVDSEAEIIPATEKLFQFNLDIPLPTEANLNTSRVELHSYVNQRGALQVGIDGKIYRAIDNTSFLGVINDPESDGVLSNYEHNAIGLGGKISTHGLPPFIQSFFTASFQTQNQCFGGVTNFTLNSNEPDLIAEIVWDFGDGSPGSTLFDPSHVYSFPGDYTVTVTITTIADEIETITRDITIFDLPKITSPATLQQCDDDTDGISDFNLSESESIIAGNDQTLTFSYHFTQTDAESSDNAIVDLENFSNSTATQLYVRVENQFSCYMVAELYLEVSTTALPSDFMLTINQCDDDLIDDNDTNGITSFNLNSVTNNILALFPSDQELIVTYYENILDGLAERNALDPADYRNENSPFRQQIVVRVDGKNDNSCIGLGFHITLNITPLPEFDLSEQEFLCLNNLPNPLIIGVQNPLGNYTYEWRDQNGVIVSEKSTSPLLEVFETGDYYVTAMTPDNCEKIKKVRVLSSNVATVQNIDVVDDSSNNMITIQVNGEGSYEYALDNIEGPYQDQNFFENVSGGIHMVFVKDINGCGVIFEEVSVIGYSRFFTPNGDGFNDTWQVQGVSFQPNSKVLIFDRFGKVLAKIDPNGEGWDGTYNGKLMPQSDYWFLVELDDGRTRRGHFSLITR